MTRYILGFKTEPDLCGMSFPCNTDLSVEADDDADWLDRDTEFERTQDAQTGYEGR